MKKTQKPKIQLESMKYVIREHIAKKLRRIISGIIKKSENERLLNAVIEGIPTPNPEKSKKNNPFVNLL